MVHKQCVHIVQSPDNELGNGFNILDHLQYFRLDN